MIPAVRIAIAALLVSAFAVAIDHPARACASDTECVQAPLLHCDPAAAASCVECIEDTHCGVGRICDRTVGRPSYTKCVECTPDRFFACTAEGKGAKCLSAGVCGCGTDDDCGVAEHGRVCVGSACSNGCRGDGSRPCPVGETCSARGSGTGICIAEDLPKPGRADAGPPTPPPPIAGIGGCSVGSSPEGPIDARIWIVMGLLALAIGIARRKRPLAMLLAGSCATLLGCSRTPTPLRPGYEGSVGLPHRGVLINGVRLEESDDVAFLRDNDRRWTTPRFAAVLARAASRVGHERPGAPLVVGDLSAKGGGMLMPHLSHRSGRDADLLLYVSTLEGASVKSPGFIHVREDGLAWDEKNKRFLRLDIARQWLLLKALLEDPEARIQFAFASNTLRALLVEWAVARGESAELVYRASTILVQPNPGGEHDDHFHVRTACTAEEVGRGCEPSGPERPWLTTPAPGEGIALATPAETEDALEPVRALFRPLDVSAGVTPSGAGARSAR